MGYSPWGCKESDTAEQINFHFLVVQWLGVCTATARMWVQPLVQKLRFHMLSSMAKKGVEGKIGKWKHREVKSFAQGHTGCLYASSMLLTKK